MIIVSQDKMKILNFKQSEGLAIKDGAFDEKNDYHDGYSVVISYDSKRFFCGEYKTEERAQEVLQEIIKLYAASELLKVPSVCPTKNISGQELAGLFIYEMPKE